MDSKFIKDLNQKLREINGIRLDVPETPEINENYVIFSFGKIRISSVKSLTLVKSYDRKGIFNEQEEEFIESIPKFKEMLTRWEEKKTGAN